MLLLSSPSESARRDRPIKLCQDSVVALGKEHMPVLDQEQVLVLDHDLVCWMLAKSKWWF